MIEIYREMLYNVRNIQKILPQANQTGNYSTEEEIKIKAYYLLVHAEIEYFIERCTLNKVNQIVANFKTTSTPHICLLSIIFSFLKEDDNVKSLRRAGNIIDLVDYMNGKFHFIINQNNGIKEENLEKMFAPLGIDYRAYLGEILIAELNSLGSKRGDYAHNALHVKSIEDPSIAMRRTVTILRGLGQFTRDFTLV